MKSFLPVLLAAAFAAALPGWAQVPLQPPSAIDLGPNHRLAEMPGAPGRPPRQVIHLANGMNYFAQDRWQPAEPFCQETPAGFVFSQVQHPARIPPDLNVRGAVAIRTPGGIDLHSTPLAVIGVITNCGGVLVETNQIVFENPFAGLCSSIVFTLNRDSWEQTVYFQGRLDPRDWGFPLDVKESN